ncbi:MAG: Ldh family oxidoreductase [Candidatus Thermoplasmatota archaeon]|nr:Ldh family oxidoreductase [Candidatus Thermoplasmatota archaeon]
MSRENVIVPFDTLEGFMKDVFMALGVPEEDASICADVLITADKRGIHSHGINRMKPFYYDRLRNGLQLPDAKLEVVREGPTTAVVDGHFGMGHAVSKKCMDMAISKAGEFGMGMVAVRNSTHFGIAGYYAMMAADAGMIGMTGTNARPSVAPTFSTEGVLGTNPFTISFPTDEEFPFVLDCATSIWQRGKIEYYAREGKKIPEGLVIGKNGAHMTDSQEILDAFLSKDAALLPLGGPEETAGYKGYGYSTVVEVLSSALQGGPFLRAITGVNVGHFFMAMDIEAFIDLDDFKATAGEIMRELRTSRKMPGKERIMTAGEPEYLYWMENREKGVPLNESLVNDLKVMREELSLKGHALPF